MHSLKPLNLEEIHGSSLKSLSILIVDDHPITCNGYVMILNSASDQGVLPKVSISMAHTLENAYEILFSRDSNKVLYDIIVLDIRLPSFPKRNIYNGEDLGRLLRKNNKKTKILVLTSLNNHYRLQTILNTLNPEGFVLKSEICNNTLILAFQSILNNIPFYSPTVLRIIKNQFIKTKNLTLLERKFLYLLSTGIPSKEIPNHLPWSTSKVERQKRILKEKLGVEEKSSWGLIHKAKELGII